MLGKALADGRNETSRRRFGGTNYPETKDANTGQEILITKNDTAVMVGVQETIISRALKDKTKVSITLVRVVGAAHYFLTIAKQPLFEG